MVYVLKVTRDNIGSESQIALANIITKLFGKSYVTILFRYLQVFFNIFVIFLNKLLNSVICNSDYDNKACFGAKYTVKT